MDHHRLSEMCKTKKNKSLISLSTTQYSFHLSKPPEFSPENMANTSKFQSQVEIKQQCCPTALRFSTELTADELINEERVPFPFFRPLSQKRANTWIISLFVILHLGAFIATMIVNDCWENSHGDCALKSLRRFSFQPLLENPLLGPSASALDEIGALRETLLTNNHQLWRIFTSPWLHAGLFHLIINLSAIIFVGLHLEQEFGPSRIGVIYILSAFTGSLVASLFVQDRPSVCSSGALVGLLGTMLSGLIRNWKYYTNKFAGLVATMTILMTSLVLGLIPYVNNFANFGGFMSGFLLGFVLLFRPQQEKQTQNKGGLFDFDAKHIVKCRNTFDKPVQRGAALVIFVFLLAGIIMAVLHDININKYCSWCHYFDCIPSKWWSCTDEAFHCEMVNSEHLTLSCSNTGRFRVLPFNNISEARFQDMCNLICS
ncbi:RHOMBOID-like protein 8 isoform X2 [Capsicum annuum]|uniref:RHOMBOID-like protein 8 isoform X2 n=1 Tax=Capsicum annuum TaxID=4072 RepID=UPI0007BEB626|nr:RHOMBOID-like protein 8 isoform X2 [Capsicum annuum]